MDERGARIARELAVLRYCASLDRGDFEGVASVLAAAETDEELERMLRQANEGQRAEQERAAQADSAAVVRELLQRQMPSAMETAAEDEMPPLTIAAVAGRIESEGRASREAPEVLQRLREVDEPVPQGLSARSVRQLLERLGVQASERFLRLFRETAILLSMGRQQQRASLAATRRERRKRETSASGEDEQP